MSTWKEEMLTLVCKNKVKHSCYKLAWNIDAAETTFKEFVKGLKEGTRCADTSAQEIFATVRMSQERNQDFEFSCTKSPKAM